MFSVGRALALLLMLWLTLDTTIVRAETPQALAHELKKLKDKVDPSAEGNNKDTPRSLPQDATQVLRCLDRSSEHGLWQPSFRYAETLRTLELLIWINEKRKLIYVQIPKCASSTIKKQLHKFGFSQIWKPSNLPVGFRWSDYFAFTFIREPLARFNAAYGTIARRMKLPSNDAAYEDYIEKIVNNDLFAFVSHHALPQTFFITNSSGLPHKIDFIGRLDTFDEDWKQLQNIIDIPAPTMMSNVREGQPQILTWLQTSASPEYKAKVCNYYLTDYLCLNYTLPEVCNIPEVHLTDTWGLQQWTSSVYGFH